jgi:hypothetical protein
MKIYQIEQIIVKRNNLWADLENYVATKALHHQAHEIEENLLKKLLKLGATLLQEVFIRFGTGKSDNPIINAAGEILPYHKMTTRQYQSIFGVIVIFRACYWKSGYASVYPLDAHFNLPEKLYSHLLVKWVQEGLKRDAVVTAHYSINPEARTAEEVLELLMRSDSKEQRKEKKEQKRRSAKGEPKAREPINKKVMASLEGKKAAFEDLADGIAKRDPSEKKPIFLQVDGAKSLEKGLLEEFEKRGWTDRIIGVALDIIHVMEYVWELSTSLHGEKSEERVIWVRKIGLAILQGRTGHVIGGLRQMATKGKNLKNSQKSVPGKVITYFDNY